MKVTVEGFTGDWVPSPGKLRPHLQRHRTKFPAHRCPLIYTVVVLFTGSFIKLVIRQRKRSWAVGGARAERRHFLEDEDERSSFSPLAYDPLSETE